MSATVKEIIQYFDDMDADGFSRAVAEDAVRAAQAALRRRRPDLSGRRDKSRDVPEEEAAQFELDQLAFVVSVADRLMADVNRIVFNARRQGASWARIGAAINQSPQTAFNRYRKLESRADTPKAQASRSGRRGTA